MRSYSVTPWRDKSELWLVRKQLYQLEENQSLDQRQEAVNKIGAWKIRGNLPHAVESTALLVDAILHHDVNKNSIFSVRATYSGAFSRFVTGFCEKCNILGHRAQSMHQVAQEIGMPASFVELRHEATHEELPDLQRLERHVRAALDWLWQFYWEDLDHSLVSSSSSATGFRALDEVPSSELAMDEKTLKDDLLFRLKCYLKDRKNEIKRSQSTLSSTTSAHPSPTCRCIVRLCSGKQERVAMLSSVFLDERLLFPIDSETTTPILMTRAFTIWDPLLVKLTVHLPLKFLRDLIEQLLLTLTLPWHMSAAYEHLRSASHAWILHILTSGVWRGVCQSRKKHDELKRIAIETCLLEPRYWTRKVARELIEASDDNFKRAWIPLFNESLPVGDDKIAEPPPPELPIPRLDPTFKSKIAFREGESVTLLGDEPGYEEWSWYKWPGIWKPKPIGLTDTDVLRLRDDP